MKGVVLAGGRATRLRPITYTMTKHLIPLANKPILFYALEALAAAGIKDVGVIVGRAHPDYPGSLDTCRDVMEAVGDGSRWGMSVTYIEQDAPRGIAHAVLMAKDFVGDDAFVTFLGDNFLAGGIQDFVREFEQTRPNALILLCRVPNPQDFGVAVLDGDRIVKLVEKPKQPPSDLALVGVYLFDHHVFDSIQKLKPSWRHELEITDAIQGLVDAGLQVRSHTVKGWWKDTGTLQDLLEANRLVLDTLETKVDGEVDSESQTLGRVVVEQHAQVKASVLQGPVIVGRGSKIIGSIVGPYVSVHENVVIENTEVANSILMEECALRGIRHKVRDSLVGKQAVVERAEDVLHSTDWHQLVLGDNSRVILA
jgi:glucose-1-phosphate thymidylyltransferase